MLIVRLSKIVMVASIALFATLVVFGNVTDYGTNFAFVQHVLAMDTIFSTSTIRYRAIADSSLHHAAYALIIAAEAVTAVLCWIGSFNLLRRFKADAVTFNRSKRMAVAGLTAGFLVWQVGFISVGGEWFGMWMSSQWNGIPSAFRFFVTILLVLIFLMQRDEELS